MWKSVKRRVRDDTVAVDAAVGAPAHWMFHAVSIIRTTLLSLHASCANGATFVPAR